MQIQPVGVRHESVSVQIVGILFGELLILPDGYRSGGKDNRLAGAGEKELSLSQAAASPAATQVNAEQISRSTIQ
jgi:hypothetical protein